MKNIYTICLTLVVAVSFLAISSNEQEPTLNSQPTVLQTWPNQAELKEQNEATISLVSSLPVVHGVNQSAAGQESAQANLSQEEAANGCPAVNNFGDPNYDKEFGPPVNTYTVCRPPGQPQAPPGFN